jgi:hypothetical protein
MQCPPHSAAAHPPAARRAARQPTGKVRKPVLYFLAAATLGAVFSLYLQPGLIVDLASRIWSCF